MDKCAGHAGQIFALAFSLDDSRLASVCESCMGHTGKINAITFDGQSRLFVSASSDRRVRFWNSAKNQYLRILNGHTDEVFAAVFQPDGTRLATGEHDREVWLWDPVVDQEETPLYGHTSCVWSLAFRPHGKTLFSGSGDSSVQMWNTESLRVRYHALHGGEFGIAVVAGEEGCGQICGDRASGSVPQRDPEARGATRRVAAIGDAIHELVRTSNLSAQFVRV